MVKLQKRATRKIGDKTYHKWTINLPTKVIEEIGFKEGDVFDVRAARGKLILSVEGKKKSRGDKIIETKAFGINRLQKGIKIFNMSMDKLEKVYGKEIPTGALEKELIKKISRKEIDWVVGTLFVEGECFFPKKDYIQRF